MKAMLAGLFAALGVIAITLFIGGGALGYGRMLEGQAAFLITAAGMLLGVVASLAGLVMLMRNGFDAKSGLALLGAPPALFLIYGVVNTRGAPLINDISTDLVYPPQFANAQTLPANDGRDMSYPESFKSQVEEAYPDLQSLAMTAQRDDVFAKALELAREQPNWTVTTTQVSDKESNIEGYATTRVFGFKDDFVIRITDADEGVVVDMRSKSRVGQGDLGKNAARIREFFEKLQT